MNDDFTSTYVILQHMLYIFHFESNKQQKIFEWSFCWMTMIACIIVEFKSWTFSEIHFNPIVRIAMWELYQLWILSELHINSNWKISRNHQIEHISSGSWIRWLSSNSENFCNFLEIPIYFSISMNSLNNITIWIEIISGKIG